MHALYTILSGFGQLSKSWTVISLFDELSFSLQHLSFGIFLEAVYLTNSFAIPLVVSPHASHFW